MTDTKQQALFELGPARSDPPSSRRRTRREAEQACIDQHKRFARMKAADAERELTMKVFALLLGGKT